MDGLSTGQLRELIEPRTGPCVTLFMPTHEAGADIQQDPIRFKNLLREADERLRSKGMKAADVEVFLADARKLLDLERIFWRSPRASFAMFIAPGFFKYFHLPLKLEEQVHVENRFRTKPLMKLFSGNGRFFVLALSQDSIRLLEATQYSVRQCELKSTPTSMAAALQYNELEQSSSMRLPTGGMSGFQSRQEGLMFAPGGGGDPNDVKKEELREYFRAVDRGLHTILAEDTAPMILAGVNYLLPIYRDVNSYAHVMTDGIVGSPELIGNDDLHTQAWPIAHEYLLTGERDAIAKFDKLSGSAKVSIDLKDILTGAHQGRVETLFIANGRETWGRYDVDADELTIESAASAENTELLDLASTQTFMTGGRVHVVEPDAVPGGESIAAVYRF